MASAGQAVGWGTSLEALRERHQELAVAATGRDALAALSLIQVVYLSAHRAQEAASRVSFVSSASLVQLAL